MDVQEGVAHHERGPRLASHRNTAAEGKDKVQRIRNDLIQHPGSGPQHGRVGAVQEPGTAFNQEEQPFLGDLEVDPAGFGDSAEIISHDDHHGIASRFVEDLIPNKGSIAVHELVDRDCPAVSVMAKSALATWPSGSADPEASMVMGSADHILCRAGRMS